ncbi:MAG: dephospho-CoA kinase [bacterium]|nr:dephospho-CoA kinase [bacterium]
MTTPFLIGLTGTIGTGKSTVADELRKLGAAVVAGDDLGKRALEESPELLEQIRHRFGSDVFRPTGELDRTALGRKAFASRESAQWLTAATFPRIHDLWRGAAAECTEDALVFDAALIFEWEIEAEFDLVVLVIASRERILERMERAGRWTCGDAEKRMAAQLPAERKKSKAHVVLSNDGTLEELRHQVRNLWHNRIISEIQDRRKGKDEADS